MDPRVIEKLRRLREYYWDDQLSLKWISSVEKRIRTLILQDSLADKKSVKAIIEDATRKISTIDKLLLTDKTMTHEQRLLWLKEKEVHQFWLDRFDNRTIEQRIENILTMLDEESTKVGIHIKGDA